MVISMLARALLASRASRKKQPHTNKRHSACQHRKRSERTVPIRKLLRPLAISRLAMFMPWLQRLIFFRFPAQRSAVEREERACGVNTTPWQLRH
jgi:hypothetical protein